MAVLLTSSSSQYFRADASTLAFNSAYTILFSVYLTSDLNTYTDFAHVETVNGSSEVDFIITNSNGTQLYLGADPGSGRTTGADLSTGTWYDLAMVRASATDLRMYRSGSQEGSTLTNNVSSRSDGRYLYLGTWFGLSEFLNGGLANIKIYNRALSADELIAEHVRIRPVSTTDMWAWYPMIGSTIADCVLDWSGNGRNLTAFNTPTVVDGPPVSYGAPIIIPQYAASIVVPTLSLPGVQSITANSAVPKVTLTW